MSAAIGVVRVRGVGGELNDATLYRAAVDVDGVAEMFEVVGWRDETIVGRDVLNRWVATFDGPSRRWSSSRIDVSAKGIVLP